MQGGNGVSKQMSTVVSIRISPGGDTGGGMLIASLEGAL